MWSSQKKLKFNDSQDENISQSINKSDIKRDNLKQPLIIKIKSSTINMEILNTVKQVQKNVQLKGSTQLVQLVRNKKNFDPRHLQSESQECLEDLQKINRNLYFLNKNIDDKLGQQVQFSHQNQFFIFNHKQKEQQDSQSNGLEQQNRNFEQSNYKKTYRSSFKKNHNNSNRSKSLKGGKFKSPLSSSAKSIIQNSRNNLIDNQALKKQKIININETKVYFPYNPYDVQINYMEQVLKCLEKKQNGLIESPTGTGKTLSLLAATLSWTHKKYIQSPLRGQNRIIYLSRTHSQLKQIKKQLQKTCFRPTMVCVASREHLCIKQDLALLKGRQKIEACSKGVQMQKNIRNGKRQIHDQKQLSKCKTVEQYNKKIQQNKQVQQTRCRFYEQKQSVIALGTSLNMNKMLDIQQMLTFGMQNVICPYYYPYYMEQYIQIFCMPYNYILDADILPRYQNIINDSIIIIDQAHNLSEAACSGRSYELFFSNIEGAINQLNKFAYSKSKQLLQLRQNLLKENGVLVTNLKQVVEDLKQLVDAYVSKIKIKFTDQKRKQYLNEDCIIKIVRSQQTEQELYEMFQSYNSDLEKQQIQNKQGQYIDLFSQFVKKIDILTNNLLYIVESLKQSSEGYFHNIEKLTTFLLKVSKLIKLKINQYYRGTPNKYQKLQQMSQIHHFRLSIKKYKTGDEYAIQLICLVPWLTFREIQKFNPHCFILTSGTMSPLGGWEKELKMKFDVKFVNDHVIKKDQIQMNIVKKGRELAFNFSYYNLQKVNLSQLYNELLQTILGISERVPNGLLVICPSFKVVKQIMNAQKGAIGERMKCVKYQIYETRNNQSYIQLFKEKAQTKEGAILYCVCRGRASQGIDFPDDLCRGVIFVGVPFANIKDPYLIEKEQHMNKLAKIFVNESLLSFDEWYFTNTIRAINQGLGRVIRHQSDFGMLFLLDARYCQKKFKNSLPAWSTKSIVTWDSCNKWELDNITAFFVKNNHQLANRTSVGNKKNKELIIDQNIQTQNKKTLKVNSFAIMMASRTKNKHKH